MEQEKKLYYFDLSYPSLGIQETKVLEETKGRYTVERNEFWTNNKGEVKVLFIQTKRLNKSQMHKDHFFEEKSEAEKSFKERLYLSKQNLEREQKLIDKKLVEISKALEDLEND